MTHYVNMRHIFPLRIWAIVIGILSLSVFVGIMQLTRLIDVSTYLYIIQPILVVGGALVTWWLTRGNKSQLRRQQEKMRLIMSIMTLWIIGYFLTGIVVTYVQNPLVASFRSILFNIIAYGIVSISLEYIRHRILLSANRRSLHISGLIVVGVFTLFQVSSIVLLFANVAFGDIIKLSVSILLPIVAYNFTQTYLAYTAGFGAMVTYATGWLVMNIFLPITPRYDWYMIGMMSLGLGLLTVAIMDRTRQDHKNPLRFKRRHWRWVNEGIFFLIVAGLVCLMTGVFSYKPLVIMSNSMVPVYSRGDMVLVEQVTPHMDIKVGDIIEYKREDRVITHRVVKIIGDAPDKTYTAKGDNNQSNDPWPIARSQIVGVVKARVPYIGYPSVVINELIHGKK